MIGCNGQSKSNHNDNDYVKSGINSIPEKLLESIETQLQELTILSSNLYLTDWKSFKSDSIPPFISSSDFNGDGDLDFAVLLMNQNNTLYLYSFIANVEDYTPILIDTFSYKNRGIDAILGITDKGEWEASDEKLLVPNDGISIDFFEKSLGWSYYWKEGKFERFLYD
jgi:hypothetical protein